MNEDIYACFDVETTRLDPNDGRVIEIAIVRIDNSGNPKGEWSTLINPETNDLGRVDIHGIDNNWLKEAPLFGDTAADMVEFFSGCIPVAHNAVFDLSFLRSEWKRAGLGALNIDAVDTLAIARNLQLPGRLIDLTKNFEISIDKAHMALSDSRALSKVLIKLLEIADFKISMPRFDLPLFTPSSSGSVLHRPEADNEISK